ncbi:MAG: hypothetical protein WCH98_16195, partial [Verrucomicrobiota bacterium]
MVTNQRIRNAAIQALYFIGNFFEDLFCNCGRFGCTNRFTMSKKKSEKEAKEKKQAAKKAPVKANPPAVVPEVAADVELKEKKTKARKPQAASGKKEAKAAAISG